MKDKKKQKQKKTEVDPNNELDIRLICKYIPLYIQ